MDDALNLLARLRAANERDVEAVLEIASYGTDLLLVDAPELLDFFNLMIDRVLGEA